MLDRRRLARPLSCSLLLFLSACAAHAQDSALPVYSRVHGSDAPYVVQRGDNLQDIAQRLGLRVESAIAMAGLADPHKLAIGQKLPVYSRHIVPGELADGLVINVGEPGLYWMKGGELVARYPVGVGRKAWRTPPGDYHIRSRQKDPVWYVPKSIQKEMREKGEEVKTSVEAGPDNPLGKYFLQLDVPGYGIHGTNAPWSVGRYTTHGCMRLRPEHIEALYQKVPDGAAVRIIDQPLKVAQTAEGRVFLEVCEGTIENPPPPLARLMELLAERSLAETVDQAKVASVLAAGWCVATDVTRSELAGR